MALLVWPITVEVIDASVCQVTWEAGVTYVCIAPILHSLYLLAMRCMRIDVIGEINVVVVTIIKLLNTMKEMRLVNSLGWRIAI